MLEKDQKDLGHIIFAARKNKGLSQIELSKLLGFEYNIIVTWENGTGKLRLQNLNNIASILNIPGYYLSGFDHILKR